MGNQSQDNSRGKRPHQASMEEFIASLMTWNYNEEPLSSGR